MPRIARGTSPIDSTTFVPPKRPAASPEKLSSPLSSPQSPSPPSSPVSSIQLPPRRQPIPAMWQNDLWERRRAFTRRNPDAPSPPSVNPVDLFATPSSGVAETPQATRPPTRFWTRGQEKWLMAPLDQPLMSPGEYRIWERAKKDKPCQTYEMYIANWRRRLRAINEAQDSSSASETSKGSTTEYDIFMSAITIAARKAQAVQESGVPTSPKAESKTPNVERRSRAIKGGLYSLVSDTNVKKRVLSDESDAENNAGRAKRRSVGSEEEIDAEGEPDDTDM
ncbi:hypothetical protein QBC40DRAFT_262494 [Triangularia verruculosa]|uniref:Uncharacterized protein n=1 Tax=Triangularia verruculosa TaxID=2587418 RepID=A0AAN6XM86_9PEZI|nr:hypothetical protein QBC40DRAFT_262494 [Triangularia verruculosa]